MTHRHYKQTCNLCESCPKKTPLEIELGQAGAEVRGRVSVVTQYIAIKCPMGEDLTVGAKRSLTVWLASGEYCVNFDDDDLSCRQVCRAHGVTMRSTYLSA